MSKNFVTHIFTLFICGIFISCSIVGIKKGNCPKIQFEETDYDFGVAGREQEIKHNFHFKNISKADLKITKIEAPCGCEARVLEKEIFKPSEEGIIEVALKTGKYIGRQQKEVIVSSNDPDTPEVKLQVSGLVERWVAIKPEALNFGQVRKGEYPKRSLKLLQLEKEPLIVEKVYSEKDYFDIDWIPFQDENMKGFEVRVVLKPTIPEGVLNEVFTIYTNVKNRPRIDVPIYAEILYKE